MIKIQNVKKKYGSITALNGVSFDIAMGKVTGLVGPNGCGKTTLIKSVLGLVVPDEGEIFVNEMLVRNDWEYRRQIGYMPQNPEFPDNLTINELLDLLVDIRGSEAPLREELFKLFNLYEYGNKSFSVLSGGTKQKVAAVAAFMFKPSILILDEPTVGLDPVSALQFKDLVRKMANSGSLVLLVSHLMSELEQLVDQMVFVLDGQVGFLGSPGELMTAAGSAPNLETAIVHMIKAK